MKKDARDKLAASIEAATEPGPEVDARIEAALIGMDYDAERFNGTLAADWSPRPFSTDRDTIMDLAPGWFLPVIEREGDRFRCRVFNKRELEFRQYESTGASEGLAVCAAVVKAL